MSELTALNIQEFYTGKIEHGRLDKKGGLSNRAVAYLHSILHQALEKAIDLELINRNPCNKIKPAKDKRRTEEKIVFLDKEQLAEFLLNSKQHQDYSLIYTAAYTGMRQSELLALTWDKILWKQGAIKVERAVNLLENGEFDDGRTKNFASTRTIDVSKRVLNQLKKHKKEQLKYLASKGIRNNQNLVFIDTNGGYMNRKNLAHRFRNLSDKNKHIDFSFHGLRHTHATILLSEGWYPNDVSKRLGHADIDTTLRIYGHVIPKQQKKLANKFDELIKER
ncbi:MAG: site-specific integrase [Syntrophomonas sp.]